MSSTKQQSRVAGLRASAKFAEPELARALAIARALEARARLDPNIGEGALERARVFLRQAQAKHRSCVSLLEAKP